MVRLQQYFELLLSLTKIAPILSFMVESRILEKLMRFVLDLQNYNNIEVVLELVSIVFASSNKAELNNKLFCDFLDKIFDTNQVAYLKNCVIPIIY